MTFPAFAKTRVFIVESDVRRSKECILSSRYLPVREQLAGHISSTAYVKEFWLRTTYEPDNFQSIAIFSYASAGTRTARQSAGSKPRWLSGLSRSFPCRTTALVCACPQSRRNAIRRQGKVATIRHNNTRSC